MEVFEVIKKRRSTRNYKDIPVEEDKIIKIIEAAILAPSASNGQPWRFIAVKDKNLLTKIVKETLGVINQWAISAPLIIVGCSVKSNIITHYYHVIGVVYYFCVRIPRNLCKSMIISSLNANFLKKFKSIKFKSVIMKITFLPSDYLINGLRNLVDIQKIESTFLLRAVRIVNDSSNTIRLKKYRFDHLIESEIVKSVIYEESMIRKKAEDIKLTLERLSHSDMAKLFMGQAELWNKEQFSTSELKQNQDRCLCKTSTLQPVW